MAHPAKNQLLFNLLGLNSMGLPMTAMPGTLPYFLRQVNDILNKHAPSNRGRGPRKANGADLGIAMFRMNPYMGPYINGMLKAQGGHSVGSRFHSLYEGMSHYSPETLAHQILQRYKPQLNA